MPAGKAALGSALPHIKSGRVRVLAVTTAERSFVDKSWPTLIESGIPDVRSSIWAGLFAPKGVPQPIIEKLYAEIAKILQMPEVKERFAAGGGVPGGMRTGGIRGRHPPGSREPQEGGGRGQRQTGMT